MLENNHGLENKSSNSKPSVIDFIRRWGQYSALDCAGLAACHGIGIANLILGYQSTENGLVAAIPNVLVSAFVIVGSISKARLMRREAIIKEEDIKLINR